jgi:hypothetical protein
MKFEQRSWIWSILLAATIFTLSGASRIATPEIGLPFSKDKVAHFLVFGLLATALLRIPCFKDRGWRGAAAAAMLTICFGGFDELRQSFTPGRSVEVADWLADSSGAIVAVIAYRQLSLYRRILEWRIFTARKMSRVEKP